MVRTLVAALAVATAPAAADTLYEEQGVSLEGTVRLVGRNAATCQVLEENESPETYAAIKANHGRPLHVWRLDYGALNASGQPLSDLTAHFQVEAEWPPCTNWTGLGQYPGPVQWAGSFETLQRTGGLEAGGEARETLYVLAIDGTEPRFANWQVDYRFGTAGEPGGEAPRAPAAVAPNLPPAAEGGPTASPLPKPLCEGQEQGAECWRELANQPGCYLWTEFHLPTYRLEWTGGCSARLASGSGTLTVIGEGEEHKHNGAYRNGKEEGHWTFRYASGSVYEGPFLNGKRHGQWMERESNGTSAEGPYVNDERHGRWVIRYADGTVDEARYVHGEYQE